jgi:pimeloyl-ACP methyl ester carboxylesterase
LEKELTVKKRLFQSILGVLLLAVFGLATAAAQTTITIVTFRIKVRTNVSVDMGATVISDSSGSTGDSILVLNGTAQTAKTFTALAQSVIGSNAGVSRMILLDYPGHGNSDIPIGGNVKFGDLTMDDYASALLASLEKLGELNLGPNAVMGHSLGAEIIQLAQTRLVRSGKTLRGEFGVKAAIFLVPDIASPLQWAAIDAGAADGLAAAFVRNDPDLGEIFDLLTTPGGPDTWVGLFYGNRAGMIAPGAPSPSEAVANGFISFDSGAMVKQLIGLPDTPGGPRKPRPSIDANIFTSSTGTIAGLITLEQDGLYAFPTEHQALYEYVTGDTTDRLFFAFTGQFTVHNIHTITPDIYNKEIKRILNASH